MAGIRSTLLITCLSKLHIVIVGQVKAQSGEGFRQGNSRARRKKDGLDIPEGTPAESKEALEGILNEVRYLRQEVEFLKKIMKTENTAAGKS